VNGLTYFINESSGQFTGTVWDFGDGSTSDTRDGYHQFTEEGVMEVTLTIENGSEIETHTEQVLIGANSPLNNKVVVNSEQLVSEKPANTYQWFRNGLPVDGADQRIYTPGNQGGTYFVVTLNEVCNNISDSVSVEVTSIENFFPEDEINDLINVYPVPVKQQVYVKWPGARGEIQVEIIDIQGKKMYIRNLLTMNDVLEVDVTMLPPGIYWLQLQNENKTILRKIIK
jgi:hypothetical protein